MYMLLPLKHPRGLKRNGEHHPSSAAVTPTGYGSRLLAMSVPHTAARGRPGNLKQLSSLLGTLLGLPPHSRSKLSSLWGSRSFRIGPVCSL